MPSHIEQRRLGYPRSQLFDLVADVEKYPDFLPWIRAVRVLRREEAALRVDMTVGLPLFTGHFASKATLDRPNRIDIVSDSPLFEEYQQYWTFAEHGAGTLVTLRSRFAFKSPLLRTASALLFGDIERSMVDAFRRRARALYGPPARQARPTDASENEET